VCLTCASYIGSLTQVSRFVNWCFRFVNLEYNLPALASIGAISKVVGLKNAKAGNLLAFTWEKGLIRFTEVDVCEACQVQVFRSHLIARSSRRPGLVVSNVSDLGSVKCTSRFGRRPTSAKRSLAAFVEIAEICSSATEAEFAAANFERAFSLA